MTGSSPKGVENTGGKEEIALYELFLLFPQCFQKTYTADKQKTGLVWERVNISFFCWCRNKNKPFSTVHFVLGLSFQTRNQTHRYMQRSSGQMCLCFLCPYIKRSGVYPITRRQILNWSKLKQSADDNFKFDEKIRKFTKRVENTVGKGEIGRYEQFLLFPQYFQKACFPGASKGVVWEWDIVLSVSVCLSV